MLRSLVLALSIVACTTAEPAPDGGNDASVPVDAVSPDAFVVDGGRDAFAVDAFAVDAFEESDAGATNELAFVATFFGGLSVFRVEGNGALTPVTGSPFDPHAHYYGVAVDAAVHFAYAIDLDAGDVVTYRVETNGSLTHLASLHVGGGPTTIAIDSSGGMLYVGLSADSSILAMPIAADGSITSGPSTTLPAAPAYLTLVDHTLYASLSAGISVFTIDATGLHGITGSPFAASAIFGGGLALDPTHVFLLNARFSLNGLHVTALALTPVAASPFTAFPASADPSATSVAFDPSGHFAYAVDMVNRTLEGVAVDVAAGTLVAVPGSPLTLAAPYSVAVDPSGRFVYVGSDGGTIIALTRNTTDGSLMPNVPGSPFAISGSQPEITIVAR